MEHRNESSTRHIAHSFRDALTGLFTVWREERNFRIQVTAAVLVIAVMIYWGFDYLEVAVITIAIVLVLTAETINTAFEDAMNKIEPSHDPLVGRIKDIAAGAVILSVIGAIAIGILVVGHHFL
jgi:diacylglycerol kinase